MVSFWLARSPIFSILAIAGCSCVHSDVIIRGPTIATWNDTSQAVEVYRSASLVVKGDEIIEIYRQNEAFEAGNATIIDMTGKILVPGFVNTHQHVWQTLYKTLIPDWPFATYFPQMSHLAPISETLSADDIYRSELMGSLELLSEGTTSWIDITSALSPETVQSALQATYESGGRSFFGAGIAPRENFTIDQQIAQIKELATNQNMNSSLVTFGLSYDGFDGSTDENRMKVLELIQTDSLKFISTHYVGGPFGNMNSPELLNREEWSLLNSSIPIVFSHASYITPYEAYLLRQTNQHISIAPESEIHAGIGHPYSHLIMDQASLAADSVFAFSTSLVQQARLWLQTVRGKLSQLVNDQWALNTKVPMTVGQAFYLATRGGALALRRPDLGIIAKGAKADFVIYDTTKANLLGWQNPVSAVMLHSNPGDISDVMVGGQFVKRNFTLTYPKLAQLTKDFEQSAETFHKKFQNWDFGELQHWFYLATYEDGPTVDVVRGNATGY